MSSSNASRRDFCIHACQTVSLLSLGSLAGGCGGSPTGPSDVPQLAVVNATISSGTITLPIDASSPLNSVGSAAHVQAGSSQFLVARTAQDMFVAVTAICTHEQCTVTGFQNQRYVCPCHGSQYTTAGTVVQGPAVAPLRQFATRFAGSVLTVTVS